MSTDHSADDSRHAPGIADRLALLGFETIRKSIRDLLAGPGWPGDSDRAREIRLKFEHLADNIDDVLNDRDPRWPWPYDDVDGEQ